MGLRILVLACKRLSLGIMALWLVIMPHIRPQVVSPQLRQYQQWQQFQQRQQQQLEDPQSAWTTSYWDLGQNITLAGHKERLDKIDGHMEHTDANVVTLGRELSDQEGSARIVFWFLGAAVTTALGVSLTNFFRIRDKEKS